MADLGEYGYFQNGGPIAVVVLGNIAFRQNHMGERRPVLTPIRSGDRGAHTGIDNGLCVTFRMIWRKYVFAVMGCYASVDFPITRRDMAEGPEVRHPDGEINGLSTSLSYDFISILLDLCISDLGCEFLDY
jgi:hypothetical protein